MTNDAHKHALKKAWKHQERQKLIASIPLIRAVASTQSLGRQSYVASA